MLCRMRAADVERETKAILEERKLEATHEHAFQQSRRAAKRVYERLDDTEKQELAAMVEAQAACGNTPELKAW
jgi:hypothetical protein